MTSFTPLEEHNDHEGETWTFWLQRDGNEDSLQALSEALSAGNAYWYAMNLDVAISEHDVDVLCEYGGQGYMDYHNKVLGKLEIPDGVSDDEFETLYKGGVRGLFVAKCQVGDCEKDSSSGTYWCRDHMGYCRCPVQKSSCPQHAD